MAKYADEIKQLKKQLESGGKGGGITSITIDEADLINANKLKEIEEETKRMQEKDKALRNNLQEKASLLEYLNDILTYLDRKRSSRQNFKKCWKNTAEKKLGMSSQC